MLQVFEAVSAKCKVAKWLVHGGGFLHSKGTWGCAAHKGILFRTSSLAKGIRFGNFSRVESRQVYALWQFWSKHCKNSVISAKNLILKKILS